MAMILHLTTIAWFLLVHASAHTARSFRSDSATLVRADTSQAVNFSKRQVVMTAVRQGVIRFHCPVGGQHETSHAWEVTYDRGTGRFEAKGLRRMPFWSHLVTITNNFMTDWEYRFCQAYERACCCYKYKGSVIGSIYDHHIDMTMADTYENTPRPVQIGEFCVEALEHDMCPAKTVILLGHAGSCNIQSVTVTNM